MVSVNSVTFDLSDCILREQSEAELAWMNSACVAHRLCLHAGPPRWQFDFTTPSAAAEFYRQQAAENGGAMLSLDPVTAAGVEGLRGLFKYRAPVPGSLAMYYVGIEWH
jgi:hypothetical protein